MSQQSSTLSSESNVRFFLPLLSAIIAITPFAIDTYLPAMKQIADYLNTDMSAMQLSVSLFLGGYALGLLLFGALADAIGRRPVMLFGLAGYGLCSLGLAYSESIFSFLLLRLLQAVIGAAATVPVAGYVKSIYGDNMAKGMSYVSMILMAAPMIAPTVGVLLMGLGHWHFIFYAMCGYALVVFLLAFIKLPKVPAKPLQHSLLYTLFHSYKVVLGEKAVRRNIFIVGLATLPFFGYLTTVSFIYLEYYGVSEQMFGILFAVNICGFLIGSFSNTRLVPRHGSAALVKVGLVLIICFGLALFLVNLWQWHLYWTVGLLSCFLASIVIFSSNNDALIVLHFKEQTGTATGVIGVLRFGSGAVAGPILAVLHDGTPMAFCYLLLGAIGGCVLLMALPKDKRQQNYQ